MRSLVYVVSCLMVFANYCVSKEKTNEMPFKSSLGYSVGGPDFFNDLKLKTIDGKDVSIKEFNEKTILITLWASWCPICKNILPSFNKLASCFKQKPLKILALSVDERDLPNLKQFFTSNKFTDLEIYQPVTIKQINGVPRTYLIKNGKTLWTFIGGSVDFGSDEFIKYLEEIIK